MLQLLGIILFIAGMAVAGLYRVSMDSGILTDLTIGLVLSGAGLFMAGGVRDYTKVRVAAQRRIHEREQARGGSSDASTPQQ
jgi:hypothetical protein